MIAPVQLKPLEREVKFGISEATTEGSTIYRDRYWQYLKQLWFISTPSSHKLLIVPSPSVVVEVGQTEDYATSAHCIDSLNQLVVSYSSS